MLLNKHIDKAYHAVQSHADDSRVILLHPQSKYRSVLVAQLISNQDTPAFYYALGPDDISLRAFIEGFTHDMANQHPTFGRHLNLLPARVYADMTGHMDDVLDYFVRELEEVSDEMFYLVLDEYDRSDEADDIHRFVEKLADVMPEHCRLVLNSRTLPRLPWISMVAKQQAALLLDDELIEDDFYGIKHTGTIDLAIYALGPGFVDFQGERIEAWEGHLPRLLFFFALDKPVVTRSEICTAFWPELPIDQAVNVFHVTKRRLHKALGMDVLVHTNSHYRVNPEFNIYYDVLDFVETLMRGRNPDTQNPFEVYQHAVKLYRGPFLQGHSEDWIAERKSAFREGYLEAMSAMAQMWIGKDRKELALKLYRQALEEYYYRDDIHREIMTLYEELGRRSEAVAHYKDMKRVYRDSDVEIEPATAQMYSDISV